MYKKGEKMLMRFFTFSVCFTISFHLVGTPPFGKKPSRYGFGVFGFLFKSFRVIYLHLDFTENLADSVFPRHDDAWTFQRRGNRSTHHRRLWRHVPRYRRRPLRKHALLAVWRRRNRAAFWRYNRPLSR